MIFQTIFTFLIGLPLLSKQDEWYEKEGYSRSKNGKIRFLNQYDLIGMPIKSVQIKENHDLLHEHLETIFSNDFEKIYLSSIRGKYDPKGPKQTYLLVEFVKPRGKPSLAFAGKVVPTLTEILLHSDVRDIRLMVYESESWQETVPAKNHLPSEHAHVFGKLLFQLDISSKQEMNVEEEKP